MEEEMLSLLNVFHFALLLVPVATTVFPVEIFIICFSAPCG